MTQTFFSYGLKKDDKKRLDATLIEVQKSGLATVGEMQLQTASPKKRDMKLLKKEQRNALLLQLMPFVNEAELPQNMGAESGLKEFWEDKHLHEQGFVLKDTGLLTKQKQSSFTQLQSQFQNSLLRSPGESVLTEG